MEMEAEDIFLGKARFEDWEDMYRNVWSKHETARFMAWKVTESEEDAKERMKRTMLFQETHDAYLVYEKKSGKAIGFAGVGETAPGIYGETGIALGPAYTGRGYGKQILKVLAAYCARLPGAKELYYHTRAENAASKALALSCGFAYRYSKQQTDPKSGEAYELEFYGRKL